MSRIPGVVLPWVLLLLSLLLASWSAAALAVEEEPCICQITERPDVLEKEKRARWMVHSLNYGVLSTISTRFNTTTATPFGNVYSFVDGFCDSSTGVPYFYGTYMDQSFQDMMQNPRASLTLTEAMLPSVCGGKAPISSCVTSTGKGDPESPVCARLTLTGTLVEVSPDPNRNNDRPEEYRMAQAALFQRHPVMQHWPKGHHWVIVKLEIEDLWFLDYFGGPSILSVSEYFATDLWLSSPGNQ